MEQQLIDTTPIRRKAEDQPVLGTPLGDQFDERGILFAIYELLYKCDPIQPPRLVSSIDTEYLNNKWRTAWFTAIDILLQEPCVHQALKKDLSTRRALSRYRSYCDIELTSRVPHTPAEVRLGDLTLKTAINGLSQILSIDDIHAWYAKATSQGLN